MPVEARLARDSVIIVVSVGWSNGLMARLLSSRRLSHEIASLIIPNWSFQTRGSRSRLGKVLVFCSAFLLSDYLAAMHPRPQDLGDPDEFLFLVPPIL